MLWLLEMTAGKVVNKMGEGMVQLMFFKLFLVMGEGLVPWFAEVILRLNIYRL